MESYQLKKAGMEQAEEVMSIYRSLVGSPGCTWSEKYPVMEDVERDIANDSLYVLYDGPAIIAATRPSGVPVTWRGSACGRSTRAGGSPRS